MLVDDLPGGLGSQVQMHMISVDLSRALRSSGRWTSATDALSNTAFPVYAQARLALSGRASASSPAASSQSQSSAPGERSGRPTGTQGTADPRYKDDDDEDDDHVLEDGVDEDIEDDGFRSSSWTDSADDSLILKDGRDIPALSLQKAAPLSTRCPGPEPSQRELRAARQAAARRAKAETVSHRRVLAAGGVPAVSKHAAATSTATRMALTSQSSAAYAPRVARLALRDRPDRMPGHIIADGRCHACAGRRDNGHDTIGRGKGGSSGSSLASDAQTIGGFLRKRGRLSRRLVRRFFTIEGSMLRNHRSSPYDRPSWAVDVSGAVIGIDPDKARVVLLIDARRRLVLYGRNVVDARLWADALVAAAEHVPSRPCPACSPKPSTPESFSIADRQEAEAGQDPTNDIWDTFRSFAALTLLNSRRSERGSDGSRSARCRDEEDEVPPHMIYQAFS
jgi:hypothetical protein